MARIAVASRLTIAQHDNHLTTNDMTTKPRLTEAEAQAWREIARLAAEIESKLGELTVTVASSCIADAHKLKVLNWIEGADTFRGMAYFCTPQSEWLGGDTQEAKNFCYRLPHIAKD